MERRIEVSPMHCDDITRYITTMLNHRVISDGLGNDIEVNATPDKGWFEVTDRNGNVGTVYIGVGR